MQHIQTYEVFKRTMIQEKVATLSLSADVSDMFKLIPDVANRKMSPINTVTPTDILTQHFLHLEKIIIYKAVKL